MANSLNLKDFLSEIDFFFVKFASILSQNGKLTDLLKSRLFRSSQNRKFFELSWPRFPFLAKLTRFGKVFESFLKFTIGLQISSIKTIKRYRYTLNEISVLISITLVNTD